MKGCLKCGRMIDSSYKNCPYCNFDFGEYDNFFKKIDMDKFLEEEKYAGFVKRLVSGMIDIYLISGLTYGLVYLINKYLNFNFYILFFVLFVILYVLINSIFERTGWHGSVGKRITRIEVFDKYENPLTFGSSLIRNILKFVNVLTLGFGFLLCASGEYKQTLGDRITNNYVLSKVNFERIENKGYALPFKRFLAFLFDIFILSGLIYIMISVPNILKLFNVNINDNINNYLSIIMLILSVTLVLFYFPFGESKRGKTYGKKIMKISVISENEEVISFPLSFIRQFLLIIDFLTFGWMLAFVNKKHQTLKDILLHTIVIDD